MKRRQTGFTLLELLIAISLGVVLTLAATMMFKRASDAARTLRDRSQVQDNARAAMNSIGQDLNLAGSGLVSTGVVVASTAKYSCDTGACGVRSFPTDPSDVNSVLYGIMPGFAIGGTVGGTTSDTLTISYADRTSSLIKCSTDTTKLCGFDAYPLAAVDTDAMTLTFNANTLPTPDDAVYGFRKGDLILLSNSKGQAAAVVTEDAVGFVVKIENGAEKDQLGLNVKTGTGSVATLVSGTPALPTTATKLNIVTYYTDVPTGSDGFVSALPARLYRQLNAQPPIAIAEQVESMRVTYDLFSEAAGNQNASPPKLPIIKNVANPAADPYSPLQIRKVNVSIAAISALPNPGSPGGSTQRVFLTTSVSPRGISFFDKYPSSKGSASY